MSLTDNIVAYYKLDGNSDDSVGSNNGTDTGFSYGDAYGLINEGGIFDGTSDYIKFTGADFSPGTGAFTVNCWIYQTSTGLYSGLTGLRTADTDDVNSLNIMASWGTQRRLGIYGIGQSGSVTLSDLNVLPQNEWVQITVIGNGGADGSRTVKLYLNGSLIVTSTGNYNLNKDTFFIGGDDFNTTYGFVGYIDEVGYWSRVLTADEITELNNSGDGLQYPFGTTFVPKMMIF